MLSKHSHISNYQRNTRKLSFSECNHQLLGATQSHLKDWLPLGRIMDTEYVALNPTRNDRNLGSFRINMRTGKWADFATGDKGRDLVSLYAYLNRLSQLSALVALEKLISTKKAIKQ